MPASASSGPEQRRMIPFNIQGWISFARFPTPGNDLDVWHHAERGLGARCSLIELRRLLTSEQAWAKSRIAEVLPLEEQVCAAEKDLNTL